MPLQRSADPPLLGLAVGASAAPPCAPRLVGDRGWRGGGWCRSGDLTIRTGDLTIRNGDLTIRNGDLGIRNGDLGIKNGDLGIRNDDL